MKLFNEIFYNGLGPYKCRLKGDIPAMGYFIFTLVGIGFILGYLIRGIA